MELLLAADFLFSPIVLCQQRAEWLAPAKILRKTKIITYLLCIKLNEDDNTKPGPTSKLENSQPNLLRLSRSLAVQTNYPYPCTVCSNHQCQMDFQHCLSETLGQPFRIWWMFSTRSLLMRFRYAPIYKTSNVAISFTCRCMWLWPPHSNGLVWSTLWYVSVINVNLEWMNTHLNSILRFFIPYEICDIKGQCFSFEIKIQIIS